MKMNHDSGLENQSLVCYEHRFCFFRCFQVNYLFFVHPAFGLRIDDEQDIADVGVVIALGESITQCQDNFLLFDVIHSSQIIRIHFSVSTIQLGLQISCMKNGYLLFLLFNYISSIYSDCKNK